MNCVIGVDAMGAGVFMASASVALSTIGERVAEMPVQRVYSGSHFISIGNCSLSAVPADNTLLVREVSHV